MTGHEIVVDIGFWSADQYLENLRRSQGRHGVAVDGDGFSVAWRSPDPRYVAKHRRPPHLVPPGRWAVLMVDWQGDRIWWRTGDLGNAVMPGLLRRVNDGVRWRDVRLATIRKVLGRR